MEGSICCPLRTSCNHLKATKLLVILLDVGKIKEALLAKWLTEVKLRMKHECLSPAAMLGVEGV